jgi:hypothetical protein
MAVMMPREKWTDERLDDLQAEMRRGFAEMRQGFAEMRQGFARVDEEIKELRREMGSINRNLQAAMVTVIVALIGSNAL